MVHPGFDPVAVRIGPLAVHWYGLMYVLGFLTVHWLVKKQLVERGEWGAIIDAKRYEGLLTWLIIGVLIGGRLGYVLFYNLPYYLAHPLKVFYVWEGGMSFHGGLIGPVVAGWWYCRRNRLPFLVLSDRIFTAAPIALAFGRLGNFINGELWGRPTSVPWGMVFPAAGPEPRHPSQLYELSLEGILLFLILWLTRNRPWATGSRVCLFLAGYGCFRIFCEFFREPDPQIGFLFDGITMGMVLSSVMILAAGLTYVLFLKKH